MTDLFQNIFMAVIGFAGGVAVAGGTFALITILGIVPRLLGGLKIGYNTYKMETVIALGGTIGSLITVYKFDVRIGITGLVIYGIFAGIFIGALAMSLAESLKVLPILFQRLKLKVGIPVLVLSLALGKAAGTFLQMYICGRG